MWPSGGRWAGRLLGAVPGSGERGGGRALPSPFWRRIWDRAVEVRIWRIKDECVWRREGFWVMDVMKTCIKSEVWGRVGARSELCGVYGRGRPS